MPATARAVLAGTRRRTRALLLRSLGNSLASPLEHAARRSGGCRGVALVYHRVGEPPGDVGRELLPALGLKLFDAQVRYLASRYRIVAASQLFEAASTRRPRDRFPIAITFDDDLRSHVEAAAPILARAGATATFFLTGASLREPHRFWWERLQDALDRDLTLSELGLPATGGGIHELGRTIEALPVQELEGVDRALRGLLGPDPDGSGLRAAHVERLSAGGFEIGFHTHRHQRLPPLADDELARAMEEGRGELESVVRRRLTTIAYPHGRANRRVATAARAAGFSAGFTGGGGPVTPESDPLLLGRVSPSYASVGELAFDVARTLASAAFR